MGFYEYMIKKHIDQVIDNLNQAYGSSTIDKLLLLRGQNIMIDHDFENNNVLTQYNYLQYEKQIKECRIYSQQESLHNKAIFDAFNNELNIYRPYYQLDGQFYPWLVSQKGISFYQINIQNIDQVFEKSKIKVLQFCSILCGIHPNLQPNSQSQQKWLQLKRQQLLNKNQKHQILQYYNQWNIQFINFDTQYRIMLTQTIINYEIQLLLNDINDII